MTRQQLQLVLARLFVIMAEVDWELRQWRAELRP